MSTNPIEKEWEKKDFIHSGDLPAVGKGWKEVAAPGGTRDLGDLWCAHKGGDQRREWPYFRTNDSLLVESKE